ncbi:MAG: hypothetical protein CVU39_26495 [Chloroflexi bacterium HGW-Chloroflexi-10]|nr:MAG: hypothetical protein CVU39_26495 [Chloroflexi bacterium HGW-Chloroflexi-10]
MEYILFIPITMLLGINVYLVWFSPRSYNKLIIWLKKSKFFSLFYLPPQWFDRSSITGLGLSADRIMITIFFLWFVFLLCLSIFGD